ncbi:MAG: Gfo/Idh/MocA family oxidoreductase [Verrucomicrobiae bacterium]
MKPTTRRSFLKTTALAAPAIVGLNLLAQAQTTREGKRGIALCGLGRFSERSIAPELAFAKDVYFAGVITGDPQGKGRQWAQQYGFPEKNIFTYADMATLADCADISIVHVVTPNGLHAEHAIAAAKAGKHVMCEKPMATSSEQCEAIIAAAKSSGVRLGVDYRLHFEPHHVEMMRLAREKVYGTVKCITAEFSWPTAPGKVWLLNKQLAGGGAAFDTGVYAIQAGCYLTGETPTYVSAIPTSTRDVFPADIEETMSYTLQFPGGAVMQGRATYATNLSQCVVACDKGIFSCVGGPQGGSPFSQSLRGKPNDKQLQLPDKQVFKAQDTLQQAVLLDEFAQAINEQRAFKCPGEMGLRDIRILEAIYASARQGGTRTAVKA